MTKKSEYIYTVVDLYETQAGQIGVGAGDGIFSTREKAAIYAVNRSIAVRNEEPLPDEFIRENHDWLIPQYGDLKVIPVRATEEFNFETETLDEVKAERDALLKEVERLRSVKEMIGFDVLESSIRELISNHRTQEDIDYVINRMKEEFQITTNWKEDAEIFATRVLQSKEVFEQIMLEKK